MYSIIDFSLKLLYLPLLDIEISIILKFSLLLLSPPTDTTKGKSGFAFKLKIEPTFKLENSVINSACLSSMSQTLTNLSVDAVIRQPLHEELYHKFIRFKTKT